MDSFILKDLPLSGGLVHQIPGLVPLPPRPMVESYAQCDADIDRRVELGARPKLTNTHMTCVKLGAQPEFSRWPTCVYRVSSGTFGF